MLLKTTRVLTWDDRVAKLNYFIQRDEETNEITLEVALPDDLYADLGNPPVITVSVAVGDTLNTPEV